MKHEGSLPQSQMPSNCPYLQPYQSNPCTNPTYWTSILILFSHLRLGLPSEFFPIRPPRQNHECTSPVSHTCYMLHPYHSSWFDYPNNIGWRVKVKVIPRQAEVAQGVPGRLRPRVFVTFRHYKGGRSSALRTGRLYPRRNPWYSLSEAESTPGKMVQSAATEKFPTDTTGNQSLDLATSSAVS